VPLTGQQHEADEVPERIGKRHDLGGQATAGSPDRLMLSPPFAPLAFW
jgi:hypothetical protein